MRQSHPARHMRALFGDKLTSLGARTALSAVLHWGDSQWRSTSNVMRGPGRPRSDAIHSRFAKSAVAGCTVALVLFWTGCKTAPTKHAAGPKKVLVVTVTKGFRHSSIPTAEKTLGQLAEKSGLFTI